MHESHWPVMNILCGLAPLQLGHVIDLLSDPLVVMDYATRYPEAIPLRKFTTSTVAEEELIGLFARHGIPHEILTDQATNFTAQLLKELYQLIGVRPIRTTPYHPQTDGLVEQFNRTLKEMLRRTLVDDKRSWDLLLPYTLFAYWEVPQASTGFSYFELLYGRDVRGPLDVLQEKWISTRKEDDSILEYIMKVREQMEQAREIVEKNLQQSQNAQKEWYDRKTRELKLHEGLVLLPTSTHKLRARWHGPYTVKRVLGRVNYEVVLPERRQPNVVFHVNMLKCWHESQPAGDQTTSIWRRRPIKPMISPPGEILRTSKHHDLERDSWTHSGRHYNSYSANLMPSCPTYLGEPC